MAVGSLFAAAAIITVGVLSILSDIVLNTGYFKPEQNTLGAALDIGGRYQVYRNGYLTDNITSLDGPEGSAISIAPGEVVVIKATIQNHGTDSAWVQDTLGIDGTNVPPFLRVGCGELTADDFLDAEGFVLNQLEQGCHGGVGGGEGSWSQMASSGKPRVLNGSSQEEDDGNAPDALKMDVDYSSDIFIGATSYEVAFSVWFDPTVATSGNEIVNISARTEALQYRGNNDRMPIVRSGDYECTETVPGSYTCTTTYDPWAEVVNWPIGIIY
ncbi:MAG: hypothetical protein LBS36_04685 [Oscillospiraceae bacterium]|jgi:hypothetical protein|nr:hypothetical protein [Oscillospiraceae bacterium]